MKLGLRKIVQTKTNMSKTMNTRSNTITALKEEINELQKDMKNLWMLYSNQTEENKKLKDFSLKVHNFAYGTDWDDEGIVSAMDFDAIVEKMKNDEKELTDEKEWSGDGVVMNKHGIMLYEETRKENEKLRECLGAVGNIITDEEKNLASSILNKFYGVLYHDESEEEDED